MLCYDWRCVVWRWGYDDDAVVGFTGKYSPNTSLREVLGQYFPPDQWAHGNMVVNISTLNNGNGEILSEGGT